MVSFFQSAPAIVPTDSSAELEAAFRASFGDLTLLAARICEVPHAVLSLTLDGIPQIFSKTGSSIREPDPFAEYVMSQSSGIFTVQDAWLDDRLGKHPEIPHPTSTKIRFYAGVAVAEASGRSVGTLAVWDSLPGLLTSPQAEGLQAVARQATHQLELRRGVQSFSRSIAEVKSAQSRLLAADRLTLVCRLAACIAHEVNNPLASVVSNLSFSAHEVSKISSPLSREVCEALEEASQGAEKIRSTIAALSRLSEADDQQALEREVRESLEGPSRRR
jgi:signal transduction histidine kinase